jgi:hypothetical protein
VLSRWRAAEAIDGSKEPIPGVDGSRKYELIETASSSPFHFHENSAIQCS